MRHTIPSIGLSSWHLSVFGVVLTSLIFGMSSVPPACHAEDAEDFFESRIRPLLEKHCLECHGEKKSEGGLRLDSRSGWRKGGDRGATIVVGQPAASLLIKALHYDDPDLSMPPEGKLRAQEITDLEQWIEQGAVDPRTGTGVKGVNRLDPDEARSFWSFQPLIRPPIPGGTEVTRELAPVDAFIRKRLNDRGMKTVPEVDRRTLIRRATFDLTGLPPTPTEIREFLSDDSPDAFVRVIDRLLASPSYGERWGRHWLEVARYADTAGDGADYPVREAFRYRNWVIDAFNEDRSFDRFVREQIAGDIIAARKAEHLSDAEYADLVTATGFLAIGKRYGYKPSPDYQHLDFADTIDSMGRSLLGLSLGCARCHDHKYDPVSMEDYYAVYGILQSTQWAFPGGEEHKRPAFFPALVPPRKAARLEAARKIQLKELDDRIRVLRTQRNRLDPDWWAGGKDLGFETQMDGRPPGEPWVHAGPIEVRTESQSPFAHIHPSGMRGIRLGSGKQTDGLRYVFPEPLRAAPGKHLHFTIDFRTVGRPERTGAYRFYLGRGVVQSLAIECSVTADEFAIRNGTEWQVVRKIEPDVWYSLNLRLDSDRRTCAGYIATQKDRTGFQDVRLAPGWDGVLDCFICDGFGHVEGPACDRDLDNLGLQDRPFLEPGHVVQKADPAAGQDQIEQLSQEIAAVLERHQTVESKPAYDVAYGVSEAMAQNARIQLRGEPDRPGREIPRRFLKVLGGERVPPDAGSGRMQLADWLTRSSNPLVARVLVNRVWQWHFGRGLVATPSDFGSRGEPPSHPELLDWMAAEFVSKGWSIKWLHRQIMLSRTYRLSSEEQSENFAKDPENRWLWRFSRRPLNAEAIRDSMLAIGGRLVRTVPQEHPFPSVSTWGFTIHNPFHGVYDSDHRSVYLMLQRNRRHPYLALFDGADPNQSVATRLPTTTPTQALFLMNSAFVHEQAEAFARRIERLPGTDHDRIRWAFEIAHGKFPSQNDLDDTTRFLHRCRKKLGAGRGLPDSDRPVWAALGRVLLTSNAFLFVN